MPLTTPLPKAHYYWRHCWPLLLLLALSGMMSFVLWSYWPQVLAQSIHWQRIMNQELSGLLRQVAENPAQAGGILLNVSFGYGVLHALGPGHGKMVLTTWLATHPSKLKTSLQLTFAAALLQGIVAISWVTLTLVGLQLSARQLHLGSVWLEKGSYLLVAVLGLLLALRGVRRLWGLLRRRPKHRVLRSAAVDDTHCGCGHQHLPRQDQLAVRDDWRTRMMVVVSMGLRPCSGAIVVLLFSKVIGVFNWGVLSVLAMALGTAMTLSGLALLVQGSRNLALRLSKKRTPVLWQQIGGATLAVAGGGVLVVTALIMWLSVQPLVRGIRPF